MKHKNTYLQRLPVRAAAVLLGFCIHTFGYGQLPTADETTAKRLTEEARVLITDSLDYQTSFDRLLRAEQFMQSSGDSLLWSEIHFQEARCLQKTGRAPQALTLLEQVIPYWQKTFGMQHEKVADAVYVRSYCQMNLKMYAEARQGLEESLAIYRKKLGEYHFKTASTLNLIGILVLNEKGWPEALPFVQQAARIYSAIPPHLYAAYPNYNLGLYYHTQRNFTEAIKYYEKSLAIREQFLPPDHRDIYSVLRVLSNCYSEAGNMEKAAQVEARGLAIAAKRFGTVSYEYANSLSSMSFYTWSMQRDVEGGIDYAEKAIAVYESIGMGQSNDCASAYTNLAICHEHLGNLDKALLYNEKALDIRILLFGENNCENTLASVNNIALCYAEMGQYQKALEYYKCALDTRLQYCEKYHPYTATSYNNIGDCYRQLGMKAEALEAFARSNEIFSSPQLDGHFQAYFPLRNLGWYYYDGHDYPTALYYFDKAIRTAEKVYSDKCPLVGDLLLASATVKNAQGQFDDAQRLVDSALVAIRFDSVANEAISRLKLIDAWQARADIFRHQYRATGQIAVLHTASDYYKKALDLLFDIALDYTESQSKNQIIRNNYAEYEKAIGVEVELDRREGRFHETAFTYAEHSKALSLYQSIRASEALHFAGIPDSMLQQERRLREDMSYFDKMRQEKFNAGGVETDTTLLALSNRFLESKRRYDAFTARLESDYPDYYRLKYNIGTAGIRYVQDTMLRGNQSLLEYFVGDSALYIFVVTRKRFEVREVPLDFPLEQWVTELRRGLCGFYVEHPNLSVLPDSVILQFTGPAHRLYEKLISPVQSLLADEVIIIPDGVLGYVPFDVLLKNEIPTPPSSRFHSYPYFGNDHLISYCYSATLLREMSGKRHNARPEFSLLAMAPFAPADAPLLSDAVHSKAEPVPGSRDTLATLLFSGKEAQAIAGIFQGKVLLGAAADKSALLQNAGRCSILHLNTHGKADDKVGEYAWLGFAGGKDSSAFDKLYVRDIYNLPLQADLVVLSACETGIGELKRGEGIISLARAFAFAGARSIVTSLWSVDDKSTGDLMQLFYQNLQKGMRKDEALARAKRDFRNANKGTKYAHPFFWAGFIPIGDMGPVARP